MKDYGLPILIALFSGFGLGVFYFGGLWLTVGKLPTARRPALLSLASFLGRLAVVVVGFYYVMDGRWDLLLACLVGFLVTRSILVRRWGPRG